MTPPVPMALKLVLRPIWRGFVASRLVKSAPPWLQRRLQWLTYRPKSRAELHRYWRCPWDGRNRPEMYLEGSARSRFLVELVRHYVAQDARVLEIGCNVGRNLHHLFAAGFTNLAGVDISEDAVRLLQRSYPAMAAAARIHTMPIEEALAHFTDGEFDVVFTMAVLEHLHDDSAKTFPEIVRVTNRILVTIEDELRYSWRQFPRNYRKVFEPLGVQQIYEVNCREVEGLGSDFFARVFRKLEVHERSSRRTDLDT